MIVLGIIPARGGSKSVPLKNIKSLRGTPLLAYAIRSAQQASSLSRFVVSTDHEDIARCAWEHGADVVDRPTAYATDTASTESALLHTLDVLEERDGFIPDIILTLEPTSPFRTAATIDRCVALFEKTDADSVIGVVETRSCYGRITDGRFSFLFPNQPRRRQEREPLYKEASIIYGTRTKTLREKQSVLGDCLYPLIVSEEEAFDINTPFDFMLAEALMTQIRHDAYATPSI